MASSAQLAIGVAVALFVSDGAQMNNVAFVEFGASLKAGHATQSRC
jgi:hypothetical protein